MKTKADPPKRKHRLSCFSRNQTRVLLDTTDSVSKHMEGVKRVLEEATGHIMERGLFW
jgi:hypothetical protein